MRPRRPSSPSRWSTGGFSFPEPWWETIKAESAKNNLDPYLVASLIRQESEFNPSVVSHANAYGLMQLLPSVGKSMAREEGISHFRDLSTARSGHQHPAGNALPARRCWTNLAG